MTVAGFLKLLPWIVILLLLIVVLWFWRLKDNAAANLLAANATISTQKTSLELDAKTIMHLTTYNTANDKIMAMFVTKMSGIDTLFGALNNSISNLRRTNADVEKYLSQPIPPALLCLLNGVCGKAAGAATVTGK